MTIRRFLVTTIATMWLALRLGEPLAAAESQEPKPEAKANTYELLNLFGDVFERVRADYVDQATDEQLIDAVTRAGADIFLSQFPLGVGSGLVQYQMQTVPAHFSGVTSGDLRRAYEHQVLTDHVTNSHNFAVEFVAENGFVGLLIAIATAVAFIRNFRRFFIRPIPFGDSPARRAHVAQACVYGCIAGVGWRCMYEAEPPIYFVFTALLVLTFVLDEIANQASGSAA